jgi:hypothetical protein
MSRNLNPDAAYIIMLIYIILSAIGILFISIGNAYTEPSKPLTKADHKRMLPVNIIIVVIGLVVNIVLLNLIFPKK